MVQLYIVTILFVQILLWYNLNLLYFYVMVQLQHTNCFMIQPKLIHLMLWYIKAPILYNIVEVLLGWSPECSKRNRESRGWIVLPFFCSRICPTKR
ncbi:unnamed protein product [Linum tenue]|uniref:Uncharacterized protein n=1 Tax=Linum tenue TaxID=586396 RepID=A0AAV0RV58_9ROSI|nr:unnamed protein product [Linum tenue]